MKAALLIWKLAEAIPYALNRLLIAPLKQKMVASAGRNVAINRRVRASGWQNVYLGKTAYLCCLRGRSGKSD